MLTTRLTTNLTTLESVSRGYEMDGSFIAKLVTRQKDQLSLATAADPDGTESAARSRDRWLSSSIPQITASSRSRMSPVDVARWLVPSRCALYAISAMRRLPVGSAS